MYSDNGRRPSVYQAAFGVQFFKEAICFSLSTQAINIVASLCDQR